jgi:hypothetical protein
VLISALELFPEIEGSESHIDLEFRDMAKKLSVFCDSLLQVGCSDDREKDKRKKRYYYYCCYFN